MLGQTVVMVTHDPAAAAYADRVVFLADGRLVDELHAPTVGAVRDALSRLDPAVAPGRAVTGMLRLTLRQVRADGLRLLLSSLAIVLGVAFVAGTLMFTDGMRAGAYERAGEFDRHTDLAAYAESDPLPPELVDRVRALDGVAAAAGELTGSAGVVGADGRPVLGYAVLAAIPTEAALQSYDVVAGRLPQRPGEVVLDDETVAEQRFTVGGPVSIGGRDGAARPYTLVGAVDVDGSSRDVGGPYIGLTGPDALAVSGEKGYGRIMVAARPGVDTAALADRIRAVVGPDVTVRDRDAILDAAVDDAVRDLRQFGMLLGTFAAVAVVVAGFVIANTFAIVLAQRSRRTALLRLVGATRGQIYRATLSEAAVTGLLASVVGVLAGAAAAGGLGVLLAGTGAPLGGGLTLTPRTLLLSLGLGTLLTVASAALPAWQGTRVAPVAALTDAAVNPVRPAGRIRLAVGALALAAGVAALAGAAPPARWCWSRPAACWPSAASWRSAPCWCRRWYGCSAGRSARRSAPPVGWPCRTRCATRAGSPPPRRPW